MNWQVAVPAYSRDYKSAKDVMADWMRGLDFLAMPSEQYINKEDADKMGLTMEIRYAKNRKFLVIQPGAPK